MTDSRAGCHEDAVLHSDRPRLQRTGGATAQVGLDALGRAKGHLAGGAADRRGVDEAAVHVNGAPGEEGGLVGQEKHDGVGRHRPRCRCGRGGRWQRWRP